MHETYSFELLFHLCLRHYHTNVVTMTINTEINMSTSTTDVIVRKSGRTQEINLLRYKLPLYSVYNCQGATVDIYLAANGKNKK